MELIYSAEDTIGTITLANPPFNTLDRPDFETVDRLQAFFDNRALKAVIVRGAGRHFSGGADLSALAEQVSSEGEGFGARLSRGRAVLRAIAEASIPVMAVIRGSCLGAGLEIALSCHFRFASNNAMFGFPEADYGIMPGLGGGGRLRRLIGRRVAIELVASGKLIRGDEAAEMGLVDRAMQSAALDAAASGYLRDLTADRSPDQVRCIMSSINNAFVLDREAALREETARFCELALRSLETGTIGEGKAE